MIHILDPNSENAKDLTELFAFQSKTEKIGQHHFGAYSFYIEEMLAAPYGYLDPIGFK